MALGGLNSVINDVPSSSMSRATAPIDPSNVSRERSVKDGVADYAAALRAAIEDPLVRAHVWVARQMAGGRTSVHVLSWFEKQPFILLFFVVAAGYGLGRVKIKGIGFGATASSLLVALGVSLLAASVGVKIAVPALASTIFFNLFMFAVGMKVGPQFISGLKRDAAKFLFFGLFIPFASVGLVFALRALTHLQPGMLPASSPAARRRPRAWPPPRRRTRAPPTVRSRSGTSRRPSPSRTASA